MGCFLACFGSKKDRKRRSSRKSKVLDGDRKYGSQKPLQLAVSLEQGSSEKSSSLVSEVPLEVPEKLEEQLRLNTRKKVTFDTKVTTYAPVSVCESTEFLPENEKGIQKKQEEEKDGLEQSSLTHSLSEDGSTTSSVGSYPPNHRYQNCRDSDDEAEEFGSEDSDLDDDDEDDLENYSDSEDEDTRIVGQKVWSESIPTEISSAQADLKEETKKIGANQSARDRSIYVHPVLNPVENLTQWKQVKSKGTPPIKPQKENFPKSNPTKSQVQEIAVDASLSNWLVSSETTPAQKASSIGPEPIRADRSMSPGSNSSVISIEDRPILGALTMEEIRQFSASNSPRKSPTRSPDEMPIIGTVGTYWNHSGGANGSSGSVSSYKGIPNTTSKYREDKRVNWHSTPFETRLERALNRHA
ncbi:hypothetical protein NMG60_11034662 [Bertholletia excelsa]